MEPRFSVIVAGGRTFEDYDFFHDALMIAINPYDWDNLEIIHGDAKGVDSMAQRFAEEHSLLSRTYPADWQRYGKQAGPIRNREMAQQGDLLVAFWDGNSPGTHNMIKVAVQSHVPTQIIPIK